MADTTIHHGVQTIIHGTSREPQPDFTPPPPPDWVTIDRLITLMAYAVLQRMLRNPTSNSIGRGMDQDIRFQIIERLEMLIELFKQPM